MKNTTTIKAFWAFVFALAMVMGSCTKTEDVASPKSQDLQLKSGGMITIPDEGLLCGTEEFCLVTGRKFVDAGKLVVSNDGIYLYVEYKTALAYKLDEVHLWIGCDGMTPKLNNGGPAPGLFPYKAEYLDGTNYYLFRIPLDELECYEDCGDELSIYAHAASGENTLWARDCDPTDASNNVDGNNWALFFKYTIACCDTPPAGECKGETAFGGSSPGGSKPWFYYFDVSKGNTQPVYAGQNLVPGASVVYDSQAGTITLIPGANLTLNAGAETIKIKGYTSAPTDREPAGQFPYKNTAGSLVVSVGAFPFYVIHMDVKVCTPTTME